ncbi:MAG: hypothetical protein IM647_07415 [Phenylobacterium sp.]|uniref:hypothetical protein n=1 Tax=Phenylobacterium sp. TaxID=1871053 RepID=UPI0025D4B584|nr:hypothetical protein [Phenylobacterium sp.]MCA3550135.1 hypothetical protein [Rhodobacter sp.]MCA6264430.1 hypothetical protein [Phenylobacterium sp.]MCA6274463.1 hypothetical protein [Phenylobacterium sp.]MCA6302067.1 hypothetical protein [Phenylobacterium sp.]MCA6305274.1 hypothetical protein [Phenylobacterium sp.]
MKRMIWTDEHDMAAAAMRWNGATNAEIGERFGISAKSVAARFCHLGKPRTRAVIEGRRKAAKVETSTPSTEAMIRTAREEQGKACERHAEAVMAEGGFCAFSEKPLGIGKWAVCLPLVWPDRRAAA